jgi:hypothetical protein
MKTANRKSPDLAVLDAEIVDQAVQFDAVGRLNLATVYQRWAAQLSDSAALLEKASGLPVVSPDKLPLN